MHSTNYYDVFIEVAEDTKATSGVAPPIKGDKKTVANYEFELVSKNPYKFTSDDVFFSVFAARNNIPKSEQKKEKEFYFSKGRPCFRASPLTKTYGWGVHSNKEGKVKRRKQCVQKSNDDKPSTGELDNNLMWLSSHN